MNLLHGLKNASLALILLVSGMATQMAKAELTPEQVKERQEARCMKAFYGLISPKQVVQYDSSETLLSTYETFILAVNQRGDIMLALAPYFALDAHKRIAETIELFDSPIMIYLAAGELKKVRKQYVAGNETSGHVNSLPSSVNANSIQNFENVIRKYRPELLADSFKGIPYSSNLQEVHLHPALKLENWDFLRNVRHEARNELHVLVSSLGLVDVMEEMNITGSQFDMVVQENLYEPMQRNTKNLEIFLELFSTDGHTNHRIQVMQRWLARIRSDERLSIREYKTLRFYLSSLDYGLAYAGITVEVLGKWDPNIVQEVK